MNKTKYYFLFSVIFLLVLSSCRDAIITYKKYNFIIDKKIQLDGEYFIRSKKDVVLECSARQFAGWDLGDTIPMKIIQNGLFKGGHVLETKNDKE